MNTENNRQVRQDACQYTAKADIANFDDIKSFAKKISQMPEFKKLTSDQKLKIIFSYPFEIQITNVMGIA